MSKKQIAPNKKNYFTQETEDYIVRYNNSIDSVEKSKIFTEHLYYPFYKLAENIIHTFKFYHTDVNQIEDLKLDVISMILQEKIDKFDPTYGAKAFSYFGTIIKRWLIAYSNKNYKREKSKVTLTENIDRPDDEKYIETSPTLSLSAFIDGWVADTYCKLNLLFPKESERQIADAVLTVFRTRQDLQIFKKKALYIYVREITNCETPSLTKVVRRLKDSFYERYDKFNAEGLITNETGVF